MTVTVGVIVTVTVGVIVTVTVTVGVTVTVTVQCGGGIQQVKSEYDKLRYEI